MPAEMEVGSTKLDVVDMERACRRTEVESWHRWGFLRMFFPGTVQSHEKIVDALEDPN